MPAICRHNTVDKQRQTAELTPFSSTPTTEALDAQRSFFTVIDAVSQRAYAAPGMSDLGMGFNNLSDCAKGLSELQRDVARSLRDEVILPLEARMSVDARAVQVSRRRRRRRSSPLSCVLMLDGVVAAYSHPHDGPRSA